MGEFGRRVLRRLIFSAALTGLYAWADYRINGEDSGIAIIQKALKARKKIKTDSKGHIILDPNEYTVE